MERKKIYTLFIIAIFIAIISIIISLVRIRPVEWDGLAAMAGILSVLVTMSVGWNILNALELEKRIRKIVNEKINKSFKEAEIDIYNAIVSDNLTQDIESAKNCTIHEEWSKLSFLYKRILEGYIKLNRKDKIEEMIDPIRLLCDAHINDIKEYNRKELITALKKAMPYSDKAYDLIKMIEQ